MKRLFGILLVLTLFYVLIQVGFRYLGNGHHVNYEIKEKDYTVKVEENATFKTKNEIDNYDFTFTINNKEFHLRTYNLFQKYDQVVKGVKYFKNNSYECIYPIFKTEEIITDILCEKDGIIYHYNDLIGKSGELDKFAKTLEKEGYDSSLFVDDTGKIVESDNEQVMIYPKNLEKNHYLGVTNYNGIYLINNYLDDKYLYKINLFNDDNYDNLIKGQVGKYYIIADYTSTYEFNTFYVVDLVYSDRKTIKYHSNISFDSYIQGVVDNVVYLFDRSSKKQYKIDVKAETIVEIGNEETGIKYYYNGKWENRKVAEAVTTNLYFGKDSIDDVNYERVDVFEHYYYYYKKISDGYEVYRSDINNKDSLTYLFKMPDISEIKYLRDYIYYKDGNSIKYYHDTKGIRTVLVNKEFEFNNTLRFYTYYSAK